MELPEFYKNNFLLIEAVLPIFAVLVLYCIFTSYLDQTTLNNLILNTKDKMYPQILVGAITMLGFIITGVSILISFTETPRLKLLKESKQYTTLFAIYFSTIKFLAVLAFITGIAMLISQIQVTILLFYFIILLVIIATMRIWRCIWVLEQFIEILQGS